MSRAMRKERNIKGYDVELRKLFALMLIPLLEIIPIPCIVKLQNWQFHIQSTTSSCIFSALKQRLSRRLLFRFPSNVPFWSLNVHFAVRNADNDISHSMHNQAPKKVI
jgi:hypothetical protein